MRIGKTVLSTLALAALTSALPLQFNEQEGWLDLRVVHTNDVHSRYLPVNDFGVSCTEQDVAEGHCYGGSARHKTVIDRLRSASKHSLLLDGGDEFQGNVTASVMNELGYDLSTIGNHEWDDGPANLARYWPKVQFPIVCANVDFTKNPELGKWVKPYHIFEDLDVAVIGYITNTTGDISNAGPTISFTDPIPVVQKYVDELEAKGIKRILALSHNGYGPDMELAAKTHGVDLIVGGHSHSYLGDPKNPNYEGPYPTVIKNLKGENTLIVQAFCWGRYIGHLDVVFNPEGQIVSWEGAPVLVEYSVKPDQHLAAEVDDWRNAFEEWGKTVLGYATESFDQGSCKQRECTMGNLVADAMLLHARTPILQKGGQDPETETRPWTDFAFINSGGIRSGLPQGNITIEEIMTTSPFGNGLVQTQMTGAEILAMLKAVSAGRYKDTQKLVTSNIQISGLRYSFESSKPLAETHLIKAEIQGYDNVWREISENQKYWVVALDFVLGGGDNILERKERKGTKLALLDAVLMDYVQNKGSITPYLDERIKDVSKAGSSLASRMVESWPPGTPEHIKSRYPGGPYEKLQDYVRLQNQNQNQGPEVGVEKLEGGVEQQVWRR
ncbi:hypothetical protein BGZ74_007023 [Mortierella antarctica]|nr:hypothetical protein BGZ74_007023 [Mortierella antarctica]